MAHRHTTSASLRWKFPHRRLAELLVTGPSLEEPAIGDGKPERRSVGGSTPSSRSISTDQMML